MNLFNDKGVRNHATILTEVFEAHRRSHRYSLIKNNPKLLDTIMFEIADIPISTLEKALKEYLESNDGKGRKSHPNYFRAIALRMHKQSFNKEPINERPFNKFGKML